LYFKLYCLEKFIIPKNVKELYICNNDILINNLPEHIEKLFIYFENDDEDVNIKIDNLPLFLKEIIIEDICYKKYIKIPFDTVVTIKNFE
jgi:hypothetical protein